MAKLKEKKNSLDEKSKKSDILGAYQSLLQELQERHSSQPHYKKEKQEEKETLEKATGLSFDGIITSLADTKLKLGKHLDALESYLLEEHKKFTDLQKSIKIAQNQLEQLHEITYQAEALEALIETQRRLKEETEQEITQAKEDFEQEIDKKRAEWAREKEETLKERTREEEAYTYDLNLKRKKEKDLYLQKQEAVEKEFQDKKVQTEQNLYKREQALAEGEKYLKDLEVQVASFPQKLEEAIQTAKDQALNEMKKEHRFQIELAEKEREGEKRLYTQQIESLIAKIKEQDKLIEKLTEKANESGRQVQEIAVKAVEGASRIKILDRQDNKEKTYGN